LPSVVIARAAQVLEALERNGRADRARGDHHPATAMQRERVPELIRALADVDVNEMTPVEALQALDGLRSEAVKYIAESTQSPKGSRTSDAVG
jgi:DNA mismatch repair ATPase MutS